MTEARTCSTVEAARRAGVTVRQLNHWASSGYLRPLRDGPPGQGSRLRWDDRDVEAAARFGALSRALGLGPVPGAELFELFAYALAAPYGEAVGVLVEVGRFTVSIEVRPVQRDAGAHGTNGKAKGKAAQ